MTIYTSTHLHIYTSPLSMCSISFWKPARSLAATLPDTVSSITRPGCTSKPGVFTSCTWFSVSCVVVLTREWTAPAAKDNFQPHNEALSKASGRHHPVATAFLGAVKAFVGPFKYLLCGHWRVRLAGHPYGYSQVADLRYTRLRDALAYALGNGSGCFLCRVR